MTAEAESEKQLGVSKGHLAHPKGSRRVIGGIEEAGMPHQMFFSRKHGSRKKP